MDDHALRNSIERLLESMVTEVVKQAECDEDDNHDCRLGGGKASSLAREYTGRILAEFASKKGGAR